MKGWHRLLVAVLAVVAAPAFAVESVYLDTVPVTNPGEYLAPANFYMQVPPPTLSFESAESLAPATVYDSGVLRPHTSTVVPGGSGGYVGFSPDAESEPERRRSGKALRVFLKAGLDNASDVPLAILRDYLGQSENIELVGEGDIHDVVVEVETMKLSSSPIVFIVVNAYKVVDGESLIFYNNFGYLGELKLVAGSTNFAVKLETALALEAEQLDN